MTVPVDQDEAFLRMLRAVADDTLGGRGWKYRGVPILTSEAARQAAFDAVVISNTSPVHAALRRDFWRQAQRGPVLDLLREERSEVAE